MRPPVTVFQTIVVVSVLLLASPSLGAKILVIVGNVNSHVLYFARAGVDLARLGHEVLMVAPSNSRRPDCLADADGTNFTYRTYKVDGDVPYANSPETSENLIRLALSTSQWEKFQTMQDFGVKILAAWEADCVRLLDDDQLMTEMKSGGYQFAIVDPLAVHCYYAIPYSMGIPYATLSINSMSFLFRVPRLASFSSTVGFTDRMTFAERLTTFVVEMAQLALVNRTTQYVDRLAPGRPSIDALGLLQNASLWFFMEDLSTNYAMPNMPNTVSVGDIMAGRPGRPLPEDLERFVAAADIGVVVVSLGSFFDFVPEDIATRFCDAFRALGNGVRVVWKLRNPEFCDGSERLKIMPWIPQNDLLAHPRVRAFVTHGGLNSLVETAYHAKPAVVIPIALDQPTNAAAAELKGFGIRLNLADFTTEQLVDSIERLLTDPSFERNARLASSIMRDRRDTPAERMSFLIEHVLKYGDRHLRTGAFELNLFEYIMFDIFAALFLIVFALLTAVVVFGCCVYRKCIRRCCCPKQEKSKSD